MFKLFLLLSLIKSLFLSLSLSFRVFDRDGNGYITRDELKSAMDMIGENVTEYQLNEMLELADADKDGRINYEGMQSLLGRRVCVCWRKLLARAAPCHCRPIVSSVPSLL